MNSQRDLATNCSTCGSSNVTELLSQEKVVLTGNILTNIDPYLIKIKEQILLCANCKNQTINWFLGDKIVPNVECHLLDPFFYKTSTTAIHCANCNIKELCTHYNSVNYTSSTN